MELERKVVCTCVCSRSARLPRAGSSHVAFTSTRAQVSSSLAIDSIKDQLWVRFSNYYSSYVSRILQVYKNSFRRCRTTVATTARTATSTRTLGATSTTLDRTGAATAAQVETVRIVCLLRVCVCQANCPVADAIRRLNLGHKPKQGSESSISSLQTKASGSSYEGDRSNTATSGTGSEILSAPGGAVSRWIPDVPLGDGVRKCSPIYYRLIVELNACD